MSEGAMPGESIELTSSRQDTCAEDHIHEDRAIKCNEESFVICNVTLISLLSA